MSSLTPEFSFDHDLDPDVAARVILVSLPQMGPARSRWLLSEHTAADAVAHLAAGSLSVSRQPPSGVTATVLAQWGASIRSADLAKVVADQLVSGRHVVGPGHRCWPFADDPEPPLVVFCAGDIELLTSDRMVSIVGTRRCSAVGRRVAHGIGLDLAAAGVSAVSGLAIGIDAAAHRGCLDAGGRPVAVVASGLDVIYPEANRALWSEVVDRGVVVSEAPVGVRPSKWRFPARNRLIASLGRATVIVESHLSGGALITADEAADRDRPVMAVPGSVISPSTEGSNGLLVDGAVPVRSASDIIDYLGIAVRAQTNIPSPPDPFFVDSAPVETVHSDTEQAGAVVDLVGDRILVELANGPAGVDDLVTATGFGAGEVLNAVSHMAIAQLINFDGVTAALPL